jgi:hypothetical protein
MSVTAETVFVTARTFLNDDAASLFTDTVLFPKLTQAHRELQAYLRARDAQVMRNMFTGIVAANATALTASPADLLEPIKLWEKVHGAANTTYVEITEQDPLDPTLPAGTTALQYWQWDDEALLFNPAASNSVDVLILYWREIPIPVLNTDLIGILFGELYLAPRTAALEAGSLGSIQDHNLFTEIALQSIDQIVKANKGRLNVPGRP